MKNSTIVSAFVVSAILLPYKTIAESGVGSAAFELVEPLTINEVKGLELGDIDISTSGFCEINPDDSVVSGSNCLPGGAVNSIANFEIIGRPGSVNIEVSGADTSIPGVTFTPIINTASIEILGGVNFGVARVGGKVEVVEGVPEMGEHTLTYTLNATY